MADYKVLVPLDGSRVAEYPLAYLKALKLLGEVKVRLVSVAEPVGPQGRLDAAEADDRELNLLITYLKDVARDVQAHDGIEVDTQVVTGSAPIRLAELAKQYAPDLLVVATHGRSGISRWRMGSVADKLIRAAECDTLVIGPAAAEQETWIDAEIVPPFKSILVPLDGSSLASQAVGVAQRYARAFGSQIHLVSVVRIPTAATGLAMEGAYSPALLEDLMDLARESLAKTARELTPEFAVTTDLRIGEAASELESYVKEKSIDLVIMTSHGRGGMVRTALGSVTDRMLSTAAAPVLIVRPVAA